MSIVIGIAAICLGMGLAIGHALGYRRGLRDGESAAILDSEDGDALGIGGGELPPDVIRFPLFSDRRTS